MKRPSGNMGRLAGAGPYAPLLAFTLLVALGLGASRLALMAWQWQQVEAAGAPLWILVQGLRSDLIAIGWVLAPLLLLLPPLAWRRREPLWTRIAGVYLPIAALFIAFMELATPQFILEFNVRPNRLFVEYLAYPREVLALLWGGYRLPLLGAIAALCLLGWWLFGHFRGYQETAGAWTARRTLAVWPVAVVAVFLGIRSNTSGPPTHLGNFAFCDDPLVNSLVANSAYTMGYSIYEMKHETGLSVRYGRMPLPEIIEEVRAGMGVAPAQFQSDEFPTLRYQPASHVRARPLNLIFVLEESLGARFVGELGGQPLTPNLDGLAEQGIWFEQLYATGTRTSRGLEAAVAGFPPTPAQSVVRLSKAQSDFFTIGSALRDAGYRNEFVYGGDANFDNRARFMLGNGFHAVHDLDDYSNPAFRGYLGVSDEDLFNKLHDRALALHAAEKPFFLLALTLTHHPPFDYPEGRIDGPTEFDAMSTARYADYALGRFLGHARNSAYWKDSLIVVMADHEGHQPSDLPVPVSGFHIPGVILGADTPALRIGSTVSQIDIAPTLLSMLGVSANVAFIGRDLTRVLPEFGNSTPPVPPRALMQYNENFGWLENNVLTVLSPDGADPDDHAEVRQFRFNPRSGALTPLATIDPGTARRVLANALMPAWLYSELRYSAGQR